jgi:hypothetical protein
MTKMWKPNKWWRERLRQQDIASAKLHSATTDDEIIEATAEHRPAVRTDYTSAS